MKWNIFGDRLSGFKTVASITDRKAEQLKAHLPSNKRKQVKIAVIDDKAFEPGINLRNHGYDVTEVGDIRKVEDIQEYQIVLCDLMGVGIFLDRDGEGAGVIREIRRNLPSVIVAAYSGATAGHDAVRKARQLADDFIKKDDDIEAWTEKLDQLIEKALDPKNIWFRVRDELCRQRVDSIEILRLEDAFVRSLEAGDSRFSALGAVAKPEKIGSAASGIVQGLISNTIFRMLGG